MKKALALILTLAMMFSLAGAALAAGTDPETQVQGGWEYYINDHGNAVITAAPDSVKQTMCVIIPGELGGAQVVQFGSGVQTVMSNNKNSGSYVLYPEGLEIIAPISTYDFNDTVGWSVPASVTDVTAGSWSSCGGALYAFQGSPAASVEGKTVIAAEDTTLPLVIEGGEGGYVTPEGVWYVPTAMVESGFRAEIMIESAENHKIASVTVNGEVTEYTAKTTTAKVTYDLSALAAGGTGVAVEFAPLAAGETEDRDFSEAVTESVIEITPGAVAEGTELPADVFYTGYTSTSNYENALGICTGDYYVYEGRLYLMVECNQSSTFTTKAEVINAYYETDGWVYGRDYDLIKLWIYGAGGGMGGASGGMGSGEASGEASGGASAESMSFGGGSGFNACYLYKLIDETDADGSPLDDYSQQNGGTNEACLMAEGVGSWIVKNFTAIGDQHGAGPSECLNFYGNGSQIHVNGGVGQRLTTSDILAEDSTTRLILDNAHVIGPANSVYSTGQGQLVIRGGDYFSCESCGHGPYCSLGGQILINTDGTNLIAENGAVNITDPQAETIPDYSLAAMTQDETGENVMVLNDHEEDVTVIVTGMDAGTALATDSGGGVIVANQVVTKSYGLRSAGVYSIGSDESWVYLYNSDCTSLQDAGLCSASSGYAYAFNCRLQGPQGLKTRASSNASTVNSGLWVENSRVSATFDAQSFEDAYPVGSPEEMIDAYADVAGIAPWDPETETYVDYLTRADEALYQAIMVDGSISFSMQDTMVLFVDPANSDKYKSGSLKWWFTDRSLTPGHSGGNKFAVIYVTGSSAPISVDSTLLVNDNYLSYGPDSEWYQSLTEDEKAQYTPADNLLVSVENGGTANLYFTNENSSTRWDVTGASDETCELTGDFYLSVPCDGSEPGTVKGAVNTINAQFVNSEWTGSVQYADDTGVCSLSFDKDSVWTVTEDSRVHSLTIEEGAVINAILFVDGQQTELLPGTYEGNLLLTPVAADADILEMDGEQYVALDSVLSLLGL